MEDIEREREREREKKKKKIIFFKGKVEREK